MLSSHINYIFVISTTYYDVLTTLEVLKVINNKFNNLLEQFLF